MKKHRKMQNKYKIKVSFEVSVTRNEIMYLEGVVYDHLKKYAHCIEIRALIIVKFQMYTSVINLLRLL